MRKLVGILIVFWIMILVMNVFSIGPRPSTPNRPATPTEEETGLSQKRAEFKAKLAEIKDEKKRALAEKLQERIDAMNLAFCERYENYLSVLENVVGKIEIIVNDLKSKGAETGKIEASIKTIKDKISQAKEKIAQQKQKDYTVAITDEKGLKNVFGQTVVQLRNDHRSLRAEIKSIRKMVGQLVIDLRSLSKSLVPTPSPATPTATSSQP